MNRGQDFDRALRDWLADGPTRLSSRALAETVSEIRATPQRARIQPLTGRRAAMSAWLAAAVAVTAAVVVLFIIVIRAQEPREVGPSAAPTAQLASGTPQLATATDSSVPTSSPTSSAAASQPPSPSSSTPTPSLFASPSPPPELAPLGPLAPGTYTSRVFDPPVSFTTTGGVVLRGERPDNVWLEPDFAPDAEFNVIGNDERGVVDRLARDDRITTSKPFELIVADRPARGIDVAAAPDAYPYGDRNDYVQEAVIVAQRAQWYFYLHPGAKGRVIELTVAGTQVLIFYEAQEADFERFAPIAADLLASLEFPT